MGSLQRRFDPQLPILFLILISIIACAGLHCDENVVTVRDPTRRYQRFMQTITIKCSDVYLPMSSIKEKNSCNGCPHLLQIVSSNIPVVPSAAFPNLKFTTILRMENLHIENILPGAFNAQHSLKEVHLAGNNITELRVGIFNSLIELGVLNLSNNNLKDLATNSLAGAINLKKLNLSSNSLVTFNESILDQNMVKLEYLDLSFNQILTVDIKASGNKIMNIDLSNNNITSIDFCFLGFGVVNISKNHLKSLGKVDCSNITHKITSLGGSFNGISELFPDAIGSSSHLERLSLQHNNISSIPTGFLSTLYGLTALNLSHNCLEQFQHGTFENLEKLQVLDISDNKLTVLKRYLHALVNLKELYIQHNQITDLGSDKIVEDLPHLKHISLGGNNFTCDDLIEIIHDFRSKNVTIAYGNARNTSNIHGISCFDDANLSTGFSENISLDFEKFIINKLGQLSDKGFKSSAMYDYFNKDFRNSDFFKYLESLQQYNSFKFNESEVFHYFDQDFENTKFFKYLENMKDNENLTNEFNRNIYEYFNKDFKNSSFVKYLEDLKNADDILNNGFSNSNMYKFFNNDFEKSKFYNFFQNLKIPQPVLNSPDNTHNVELAKLVDNPSIVTPSATKTLLIITVLLLVVIIVILIILTFIVYANFNRKTRDNEHLELIDAAQN